MGYILALKDGSQHTILAEQDLFELIGQYMGPEMKDAVTEILRERQIDYDRYEAEISGLRKRHKDVMQALDEQSQSLADLIAEKNLDRRAISAVAGNIRGTIYRENSRWD